MFILPPVVSVQKADAQDQNLNIKSGTSFLNKLFKHKLTPLKTQRSDFHIEMVRF